MAKIIISPSKYVQGNGQLKNIKDNTRSLGKSFFIIIAEIPGADDIKKTIQESFKGEEVKLIFESFNGECCKTEINRLKQMLEKNNCDAVIGIGGGKTFDTSKAVGHYAKVPVCIVPTIASSDAPCSALSVIYTEDGVFSEYLVLPKNLDLVLIDSGIVAKAPARLLVAGIGDALANTISRCIRKTSQSIVYIKIKKVLTKIGSSLFTNVE